MILPTFSLKLVPKILFGVTSFDKLGETIPLFGRHPLIITGNQSFLGTGFGSQLKKILSDSGYRYHIIQIAGEPSPVTIDTIVETYRGENVDMVIGIGGGAVLDSGKAISAMLCEEEGITTFLEGVGNKQPSGRKLPFIAIPTTAGTGSEATSNAVISQIGDRGFKKSLRHDNYLPNVAIVDPRLTLGCPSQLTGSCGLDCFTQLVEGYLSTKSNPITNMLALDGIHAVGRSLKQATSDGSDLAARTDLAYAALLSGIVLANAGLGTVHGFASVIGGLFPVPHAVVCGNLMAPTNRLTLEQLRVLDPENPALAKYSRLGQIFAEETGRADDWYQDFFIAELEQLVTDLNIPGLRQFGITEDDLEKIAGSTGNKNNPTPLDKAILQEIVRRRLD